MAAENIRPKVVKLNEEYSVSYDLNALCLLEERFGTIQGAFEAMSAGEDRQPKLTDVRFMLYAGLVHQNENITEKEVGKLIGLNGIKDVVPICARALVDSMPEPEDSTKN